MKVKKLRRFSVIFYWVVIIALLCLFFTNDFGLVDIRKTSIISAVGIDCEGEEVVVTAQMAIPKPSQSGESIEYTQIQGSGMTVADALNEINSKTGFYPKLLFCQLILIGESCRDKELFRILGCFYRKNYSELTAEVAMCKGKASDMLAMPTPTSDSTSTAIQNALGDELKKSAIVVSVDLKDIAVANFSKSRSCYMPYIEANVQGTSEKGGDGDNVGGDPPSGGGSQSSGGSSSGSQQSSGGGEGGGSSGGSSSGGAQGSGEPVEFTARRTAVFSDGKFAGILDERQSFALGILKNEINLAVMPCDAEDLHYSIGLKNTKGGISLAVKEGRPELTLSFEASAQIAGIRKIVDPKETVNDDILPAEVIEGAENEIKSRLSSLVDACVGWNGDVFGARELLYKYHPNFFEAFSKDLLERMKVSLNVKVKSIS